MKVIKNEFSNENRAQIAHDFRIVIGNVYSLNELLFEEIGTQINPEAKNFIKLIAEQCKLGFELTEEIICESSVKTILLNELLEQQIRLYKYRVIPKNINLKTEIAENSIFIKTNPVKLTRILNNFIDNAIKFTHRNGEIEICLSVNKIISVKDSGIGIKKEFQNEIFEEKNQYLRNGTEKELSSGLGLNICKQLAEEINAKIWLESVENKGTTFFLEL